MLTRPGKSEAEARWQRLRPNGDCEAEADAEARDVA